MSRDCNMLFIALRDAERARQHKRGVGLWPSMICACVIAAFVVWIGGNAIGVW